MQHIVIAINNKINRIIRKVNVIKTSVIKTVHSTVHATDNQEIRAVIRNYVSTTTIFVIS